MSKKIVSDIVSEKYDIVVSFLIDDWFEAIWNPSSGNMVYNF